MTQSAKVERLYWMTDAPLAVRIAMWSGPRNISTAMMRSWGSRGDTAVCDEPFYAHYLASTGLEHPGRAEVLTAHETDWDEVVRFVTGPVPGGKPVFYQKHMGHHLPADLPSDPTAPDPRTAFVDDLTNVLLIREPREMLISLAKVLPSPQVRETGLLQQLWLLKRLSANGGRTIPILDARDVLEQPRRMLGLLCDAVSVPFDEAMLAWEPGPRDTDGVWARHWYANVERSTGFAAYKPKDDPLPAPLTDVLMECERIYQILYEQRLR